MAVVLAGLVLASAAAFAQGSSAQGQTPAPLPPQTPYLRIAAAFHTQVVNAVVQDPTGAIAATASDDKTIRIWRAESGEALATLRVPIGDGDEGQIYAIAISPDGKTLLAGGQTGAAWDGSFAIYLFDVESQKLKGRLPNLPAAINHIAYAPNGRTFAVALGGGQGVRLFDSASGRIIASDDEGFRERTTWVAFDRTGRFAESSLDGEIRLYDAAGKRIGRRVPVPGGQPYSVAFSAAGDTLAVGYSNQPRVELLSARDLSPRGSLVGPKGEAGGLGAVAWGKNERLFAAGSVRNAAGVVVVRSWLAGPRAAPVDWPAAQDTVFQVDPTDEGGVLVASADPALVRLRPTGAIAFRNASPGVDFRDIAERRFSLSRDGYAVTMQARGMAEPLTIDMAQRSVGGAPSGGTRALVAVAAAPPIQVTNWRNSRTPQIEGRPIKLEAQEYARSYANALGQDLVIIGSDYQLRVFRRDGSAVGDGVPLPAAAWGLAVSGDGKVVVAAVGDGTLRWFGLDAQGTLTPRMAMFVTADGKRWIAWTPEGQFDHSDSGGKELVGLQINRQRGQAPEWFSFAQVYRLMYAPDAVTSRLRGVAPPPGSDPASVANELRQAIGGRPQSEVEVLSICWSKTGGQTCTDLAPTNVARGLRQRTGPDDEIELALPAGVGATSIRYRVRGATGKANVDVFVNGRNVMRSIPETRSGGDDSLLPPVPLDSGVNQIQLRAYDSERLTYAQSRVVQVSRPAVAAAVASLGTSPGPGGAAPGGALGAAPGGGAKLETPAPPQKPNVYILVAGVDKYHTGINSLNFAVADARSVGEAIKARVPASYGQAKLIALYDKDSTADRVRLELKKIADVARPEDTVLIYLSGHGITIDKRYYFVTENVTSVDAIPKQAFSEIDLVESMAAIRARNGMVFIDTCHAGAFSLDSASQIAHESGRYVLAASASLEEALDSYDNHNGVFATAVLRGLQGGAAGGKAEVDNFGLGFFVRDLVKDLAAEKHHDQSARFKIATEDAKPFPIVEVTKK